MNSLPRVPDDLRIGEEISRGAYGAVFAGLLGARPVAIKKIHQLLLDYASQTQEALEATLSSFRRECELLEAAKDPNIVEFIGAFNHERLDRFPPSYGVDGPDVGEIPQGQQRKTHDKGTGRHLPTNSVRIEVSSPPRSPDPPPRSDPEEHPLERQ